MAKPMLKRVGKTKCVNCDELVAVKETGRQFVRYDCEFCGHSEAARDAAGDARCRARWGIGSPAAEPKPEASAKGPAPTPAPSPAPVPAPSPAPKQGASGKQPTPTPPKPKASGPWASLIG